jgi:hypothetical protein
MTTTITKKMTTKSGKELLLNFEIDKKIENNYGLSGNVKCFFNNHQLFFKFINKDNCVLNCLVAKGVAKKEICNFLNLKINNDKDLILSFPDSEWKEIEEIKEKNEKEYKNYAKKEAKKIVEQKIKVCEKDIERAVWEELCSSLNNYRKVFVSEENGNEGILTLDDYDYRRNKQYFIFEKEIIKNNKVEENEIEEIKYKAIGNEELTENEKNTLRDNDFDYLIGNAY